MGQLAQYIKGPNTQKPTNSPPAIFHSAKTIHPQTLSVANTEDLKILKLRSKSHEKMMEEHIEKLRGVVRDCVSKHLYSSAIFFADKVAAFTSDPADIYMQAQALFLGRHYRRAFHLLNASQIVLRDLRFRYLAAKCLVGLLFLPHFVLLFYCQLGLLFFCVLCLNLLIAWEPFYLKEEIISFDF